MRTLRELIEAVAYATALGFLCILGAVVALAAAGAVVWLVVAAYLAVVA